MNLRQSGPGETKQPDPKARRSVEQEPESRFILTALVARILDALGAVSLDEWEPESVGSKVSDEDGDKGHVGRNDAELVLLVIDQGE